MASAKEIRTKIKSIKNTQKITKAMEMVAASKMRKAQDRIEAARPYSDLIRRVIGHLREANPDYQHPYLSEREVKRVGYIIVSTDRGLCGGLNTNLFRAAIADMAEWNEKNVEIDLTQIGAKGAAFFRRYGGNIVAQVSHLGDIPHLENLIGTIKIMLDAYSEGTIDRLYLVPPVRMRCCPTARDTPAIRCNATASRPADRQHRVRRCSPNAPATSLCLLQRRAIAAASSAVASSY